MLHQVGKDLGAFQRMIRPNKNVNSLRKFETMGAPCSSEKHAHHARGRISQLHGVAPTRLTPRFDQELPASVVLPGERSHSLT